MVGIISRRKSKIQTLNNLNVTWSLVHNQKRTNPGIRNMDEVNHDYKFELEPQGCFECALALSGAS